MTHSLTLEVPDNIYQSLIDKASKNGKKIEEVALEKLANGDEQHIDDPLDEFVGAFRSEVPDWAENHDKYLGESLYRELRGENE